VRVSFSVLSRREVAGFAAALLLRRDKLGLDPISAYNDSTQHRRAGVSLRAIDLDQICGKGKMRPLTSGSLSQRLGLERF
jgi:hypothetical protein